jgi:diphthine-ammonia ligase
MYETKTYNELISKNDKFVASFSGGKDSTLAIYRCIKQGMMPVSTITTFPLDESKSWFHKITEKTFVDISESINIPSKVIKTSPKDYQINFEKALIDAKNNDATVAVFGDIDIQEHLDWCTKRCETVGIKAYFPLWKEDREKLVREFIDSGFVAKIISVNHKNLSEGFLGEILTHELIDKISKANVDVCGENGEYHTVVTNGPIFKTPINIPNIK